MRSRLPASLVLATLLLTGVGATACGNDSNPDGGPASDASPADGAAVRVDDNLFDPEEVTVGVDGTVTWEWVGNEPHNVVGDDFKSDIQQEGTFEHTFEEAGSYDYVCTVHPGMKGSVEVTS